MSEIILEADFDLADNKTSDVFESLRTIVNQFRHQTPTYPWPDNLDCLCFALTEMGEALDAMMRKIGGYKRNNEKDHTVPAELGDALFMLLSMTDVDNNSPAPLELYHPMGDQTQTTLLFWAVSLITSAILRLRSGDVDGCYYHAGLAASCIMHISDFSPVLNTTQTMLKLKEKHGLDEVRI